MRVFKWTALAVAISSALPALAQTADTEQAGNGRQTTQQSDNQAAENTAQDSDIEIVEVKGVKQADQL